MTLDESLVEQGSLANVSQFGWFGTPKREMASTCARNISDCCPRWFLNKYNVEISIDFKNGVDDEIILLYVLWEYFQFF